MQFVDVCRVRVTLLVIALLASLTGFTIEPPAGHGVPLVAGTLPVQLEHAPQTLEERALPLVYWNERFTEPQRWEIFVLRVDLQAPEIDVIAMPADDPDGDGPAEAVLTAPIELARRYSAVAAVNANGFAGIPGPDGKRDELWRIGLPVDIQGLAVSGGQIRSSSAAEGPNNLGFWLDGDGKAHIQTYPAEAVHMREGINAWWTDLVKDGRVLPNVDEVRHPRTALGLDVEGRWLFLVVVDGRQPGYSDGMTMAELAALMVRLGCARAINLDGGGSSVFLTADRTGALEIKNRPSGGQPRPLPVMLGIRARHARAME